MFVLLLLVTLHSLAALDPAHLKPGALTAHLGRVALIEDSVWIKYPFGSLRSIPDRLTQLTDELSDRLQSINDHIPTQSSLLRERLQHLKDLVETERDTYANIHVKHRSKRGLIDGLGQLSRTLFGTALDSDVQDLRNRYDTLATATVANSKTVHLNSKNIAKLNDNIHKIFDYTHKMEVQINKAIATLSYRDHILDIFLTLSTLENVVRNVLNLNERLLTNVVDASRGRVTPSLLPVEDLLHALELGERKYKLKPIFTEADLIHYYPLLSSMLSSDAIVIIVPFQSKDVFKAHRIVPFPVHVNKTVITLALPDMVVLINEPRTLYATASNEEFNMNCKVERFGLYFCPASLFAFLPVDTEGVCEVTLIGTQQDASRCLSLCPYTHLIEQPFYHRSFLDHHYFLFLQPTYVSVRCQSNYTEQKVSGHFAVLKLCTLRSKNVNIMSEKLQEGFVATVPKIIYPLQTLENLNMSSIKYVTNSISELKFSNLTELESAVHDSLPIYVRPYVHYPSVILPLIILIAIVIPLCCLVKKALTLYHVLQARVAQRTAATRTSDTDRNSDASR